MKVFKAGTLTALLLTLLFTPASATIMVKLDTKGLTKRADAILQGKCVGKRSEWIGKVILTEVDLEVEKYHKGNMGRMVTITLPGGRAIHPYTGVPIRQTVPGSPSFRKDEELLLFIKRKGKGKGKNIVVGMQQGKFTIKKDKKGKKFILNPLRPEKKGKGKTKKVFMDDFVKEISSILKEENNLRGKDK